MKFELYLNLFKLLKNDYQRYHHSILVSFMTKELLKNYNISCDDAIIGALYHDCCKNFTAVDYLNLIGKKYYQYKDKLSLHGYGAYIYLKKVLNINNKHVLNGVRYHTELNKKSNIITKIIYLADKIEKSRTYKEVQLIRDLAYFNIDLALLTFIKYLNIFLSENNSNTTNKMERYLINKGVQLVKRNN